MAKITKITDKVNVNELTKAEIADYALAHFGATVNRKKGRKDVIKEFKEFEKDFIHDLKLEEDVKIEANEKRKRDAKVVIKKNDEKIDEKIEYPSEIKGDDGETAMHRPCKGALCLGDPPTRQVVDGEAVTNSAPHLKQD